MAEKCCENCVGLNQKLERVLKEIEELKRIITAQGVGLNTDNAESADSDLQEHNGAIEEEEEDDGDYLGRYLRHCYEPHDWIPIPIPGYVPEPLRPYPFVPNPFVPSTSSLPRPELSPNTPPSPPNISSEPSPKQM